MDGDFDQYVKKIHTDQELFDVIIKNFPCFCDERTYRGKKIYFYKLAQLLTSDILHLQEKKENKKVDYSHLVGCADYKIPQVMRALELVQYTSELSQKVDCKEEIAFNSEEEIEIRASQIVVIDQIKKLLNNQMCAIDINDYLWRQSRNKELKLKPFHLTRNTNY